MRPARCRLAGWPICQVSIDTALLIFDHEGSGREATAPRELQGMLNQQFAGSAWGDRARAIVLVPELEGWIWGDSPHVDEVASWVNRDPGLRPWLIERGYLEEGQAKPERPKEAFQAALREVGKPRSSSLYEQLARRVSLRQCTATRPSWNSGIC